MSNQKSFKSDIAIIGMAGRFPMSKDIDQFWSNIKNGVESISFFSEKELIQSGVSSETLNQENYIRAKGFLDGATLFDANFFDFTPHEAETLDPQFRLFLEVAWEALENAAYDPSQTSKKFGVFAGSSSFGSYYINNLIPQNKENSLSQDFSLLTNNAKDFLAPLIGYKLNLTGPCITVQTACSTSMVAIAMACENLLASRCDIALAGGVSITTPLKSGYLFQEGMVLSQDGHCRSFDAKASGTVPGNGLGVLILKRLSQAIADHDHIHAVIKGFAVNNDGNNKMNFSSPSIDGQREVIQSALSMAKISPDEISYIETHGTATRLGDPLEIEALRDVFADVKTKKSIALGALKPNIGHLDVASGVASVIKTIQALKYEAMPPTINFEQLNPEIDFSDTPFYINRIQTAWPQDKYPRTAGVSAFGIGGTNAHLILQESPQPKAAKKEKKSSLMLLILSAKTRSALIRKRRSLIHVIESQPEISLTNIAYTLQIGRKSMQCRFACLCSSKEEAIKKLSDLDKQEILTTDKKTLTVSEKKNFQVIYSLAKAWLNNKTCDWTKIYKNIPARIPLPTYPFESREYWISPKNQPHQNIQDVKMFDTTQLSIELLEKKLIGIFKNFLGVDKINAIDDFYDLGGDSLLLLQIVAKIEKELKLTLPPKIIEKNSSVRSLAQFIKSQIKE